MPDAFEKLTELKNAVRKIRDRDPDSELAEIVGLMLPVLESVSKVPEIMRGYQETVDKLLEKQDDTARIEQRLDALEIRTAPPRKSDALSSDDFR